nr:MAG TPA_asm: tail tape measure protein [Caudoviricetes sp.]
MNLLDLAVLISVDDKASEKISNVAVATGNLMSGIQKGAAVGISVVQQVAAAVGSVLDTTVGAVATYEQMAGGIAKLYGNAGQTLEEYAAANAMAADEATAAWDRNNQAQELMMQNAWNAWKTTGQNANDYMETATQFSASLVSSLGGDTLKAAELTDVAMRAMSDNVNTFGTDFNSVSDAFKGFSKANFTMLDNLKLGYGGSREEMERLIKDANEYRASIGESSDLTIDSFADQIEAIQSIQEKQQIAGTTAKEAATTIEGSTSMAKAAWENLATTIGGGTLENVRTAMGDFGESVLTVLGNVVPAAATALTNLGDLFATGMPVTLDKIQYAIETYAPILGEAIGHLFSGIGTFIVEAGPGIAEYVGEMLSSALTSGAAVAANVLPDIIRTIGSLIGSFFLGLLPSELGEPLNTAFTETFNGLGDIAESGFSFLSDTLPTLLSDAATTIGTVIQGILDTCGPIFEAIGTAAEGAFQWLSENAPGAIDTAFATIDGAISAAGEVISPILEGIGTALDGAFAWFESGGADTVTTVIGNIQTVFETFGNIISTAWDTIGTVLSNFADGFSRTFNDSTTSALDGLMSAFQGLVDVLSGNDEAFSSFMETMEPIISTLADLFGSTLATAITLVVDVISAVITIISSVITAFQDFVTNLGEVPAQVETFITNVQTFFSELPGKIQTFLTEVITNAATWVTDMAGKATEMGQGFLDAVTEKFGDVLDWAGNIGSSIIDAIGNMGSLLYNQGAAIIEGFLNGLKSMWDSVTGWVSGIGEWIAANKGPIDYDRVLLIPHGKAIMAGLQEGMQTGFTGVQDDVLGMADELEDAFGTPKFDASGYFDQLDKLTPKGGYEELFANGGNLSVYNITIDGAQVNQDVAQMTGDYLLELARIGAL